MSSWGCRNSRCRGPDLALGPQGPAPLLHRLNVTWNKSPEELSRGPSVLSSGKWPSGWTRLIPRPQPSRTRCLHFPARPGFQETPCSRTKSRLSQCSPGEWLREVFSKANGFLPRGTLLFQVKAPTPSLSARRALKSPSLPGSRAPLPPSAPDELEVPFTPHPCASPIAPQS